MRVSTVALLMTATLLVASTTVSHAQRGDGHRGGHAGDHGHSGAHGPVIVGVGPTWWGPAYPYDPYPWAYPYPPYYGYPAPPVVTQEEPPVYLERQPPGPPEAYWYYCSSARAYYPDVDKCPEGWLKVPPAAEDER